MEAMLIILVSPAWLLCGLLKSACYCWLFFLPSGDFIPPSSAMGQRPTRRGSGEHSTHSQRNRPTDRPTNRRTVFFTMQRNKSHATFCARRQNCPFRLRAPSALARLSTHRSRELSDRARAPVGRSTKRPAARQNGWQHVLREHL